MDPVTIQEVEPADWERYVNIVACNIMEEQSPQRLMTVRNQFYELLACCIPPELIMQVLNQILFAAFFLPS